jgi:hypothetical protein
MIGPMRLCRGAKGNEDMPVREKKLIGTVVLVLLVAVYALVATTVAVARLGESGPLVHLAYFFFTGFLWVLPAMLVIRWMVRPPRGKAG